MLKQTKEGIQISLKVTPRSGKNIVIGFQEGFEQLTKI